MSNAATRVSQCLSAAAMLAVVVATSSEARDDENDKSKFLTRSVYVPVEFALCEHLHDGVLYMGDRAIAVLPSKRIFQFTYYPSLGRIEPVRTDVRVEGTREDGSEFIGKLAVTPWGIFTASSRVELDLDAQLERLRYKLDVRFDPLLLRLRHDDDCPRGESPATTADAAVSDEH